MDMDMDSSLLKLSQKHSPISNKDETTSKEPSTEDRGPSMSTTASGVSPESQLTYDGVDDRDNEFSSSLVKLSLKCSSIPNRFSAKGRSKHRRSLSSITTPEEAYYNKSIMLTGSKDAKSIVGQDSARPLSSSVQVRLEKDGVNLLNPSSPQSESQSSPAGPMVDNHRVDATNPSVVITEPDSEMEEISDCYIRQNGRTSRPSMRRILMAGYIAKEFPDEADVRSRITSRIPPSSGMNYLEVPGNNELWSIRKEVRNEIHNRSLLGQVTDKRQTYAEKYLIWKERRNEENSHEKLKVKDLGLGGLNSEIEAVEALENRPTASKRTNNDDCQANEDNGCRKSENDDGDGGKTKIDVKKPTQSNQKKKLANDDKSIKETKNGSKKSSRSKQKKDTSKVRDVKENDTSSSYDYDTEDEREMSDRGFMIRQKLGRRIGFRPSNRGLDFVGWD